MATKPKTAWLRKTPRGFAPALLRVDQAAASTVAAAGRPSRDWKASSRQKALGLRPPRLAETPPWPHRTSANDEHLGQPASLLFTKYLAVQPACRSTDLAFACRASRLLLRPRGVLAFSRGWRLHRCVFRFSSPAPNDCVSGGACCPNSRRANAALNFCRHGFQGAQPRPLHARLGATPPCCFGLFAPFAPAQQPRGFAARTTAGCTRLCPAESLTSARRPAACAHHSTTKAWAFARTVFSLAQALALRKHLSPARWRPNQKPLG